MSKFTSRSVVLILLALVLECTNSSSNRYETITPSNSTPLAAAPSPTFSPEKGKEEKSFSFSAKGGKKITGYVYPDTDKPNGKMIIFAPFLDKTDGNLYNASLNSLWNVYGEKRGLFQLADAKTEFDAGLGGNAICWEVFNPKQQFCVFPIKDSESDGLGVFRVWLK